MVSKNQKPDQLIKQGAVLTMDGTVKGARRTFPIAVFVVPFGIAFGAAAVEAGLPGFLAVAMSALTFSGAAQFAALAWAASRLSWAWIALSMSETSRILALGTWLKALRYQCTTQRCQRAWG